MKMGEIRVRPDGGFAMMTPGGQLRDVTLRCTVAGAVEVEEVVGNVISVAPLTIGLLSSDAVRATQHVVDIHRAHGDLNRARGALGRLDALGDVQGSVCTCGTALTPQPFRGHHERCPAAASGDSHLLT